MMKSKLSDEVLTALREAERAPGWNNRPRDVRRFNLLGNFGHGCALYIVPFRCWAYRRRERMADAWRREQTGARLG